MGSWRTRFFGNIDDDRIYHLHYIVPLIKRLYNVTPSVYLTPKRTLITLQIGSVGIARFKNALGLPIGPKNSIAIPKIILGNDHLATCCLRGLFDTDGSISFCRVSKKYHSYPNVCLGSISKTAIEQASNVLTRLNTEFITSEYTDKRGNRKTLYLIWIRGRDKVQTYLQKVGFRNPGQLSKPMVCQKYGCCPPHTTFSQRVAMLAEKLDPYDYYQKGRTAFPKPINIPQETLISVLETMQRQYGTLLTLPSLSFLWERIIELMRKGDEMVPTAGLPPSEHISSRI